MLSILASSAARQFLYQEGTSLTVHWCPAHMSEARGTIAQNDFVDEQAKLAAREPQPTTVSFSTARLSTTEAAVHAWRDVMTLGTYRGRPWLLSDPMPKLISHVASSHYFLKRFGHSNRGFTRLCRFITGNFPHGAHRARFHIEGPRKCICGAFETRDHILQECPLWLRWPTPGIQRHNSELSSGKDTLQGADLRISAHDVIMFLRLNPVVGTFEWSDAVEKALSVQHEDGTQAYTPNHVASLVQLRATNWATDPTDRSQESAQTFAKEWRMIHDPGGLLDKDD